MDSTSATEGRFALVVDDNSQAAAINASMLEANGWTVERARDGFEAIHRFGLRNYDVLLLDYGLPGMDGAEVLAWVRRNLPAAPQVVVVSAECPEFLKTRFAGMGVQAILTKPLAPADLFRVLQAA